MVASLAEQYGIRIYKETKMAYHEFYKLVSSLSPDTPLGRVVSIRAETDPERLKEFTPAMRKIRNDWLAKIAKERPEDENQAFLGSMLEMFKSLAD